MDSARKTAVWEEPVFAREGLQRHGLKAVLDAGVVLMNKKFVD